MKQHIHFASYSPAADIVVTAVCFVMIILVVFSNISKTRGFKLFFVLVGLVLGAAWTDITFYTLAADPKYQTVANWMRCIYHALLFLIFVYYIAYICEVTNYENQKPYLILANTIFFGVTIADIISTIQGPTFTVDTAGIHFIGRGIFFYGYIAFYAPLYPSDGKGKKAPVPPGHVRILWNDGCFVPGASDAGDERPVFLYGFDTDVSGNRHDVCSAFEPVRCGTGIQ